MTCRIKHGYNDANEKYLDNLKKKTTLPNKHLRTNVTKLQVSDWSVRYFKFYLVCKWALWEAWEGINMTFPTPTLNYFSNKKSITLQKKNVTLYNGEANQNQANYETSQMLDGI